MLVDGSDSKILFFKVEMCMPGLLFGFDGRHSSLYPRSFWLSATQNMSFLSAGGTVIALLTFSGLNGMVFASLVGVTYLSGAVAVLSTLAGTILVEREWVVVMTEDQPSGVLSKMNSVLRRNDLGLQTMCFGHFWLYPLRMKDDKKREMVSEEDTSVILA